MDFNGNLKIGELFEIEADGSRARTKLQEITEDGDFIIMQPTVKGIPLRPHPDEPAKFTFCREDGVYTFKALMLPPFTRENIRMCRCRPVTEIKQTQRRQYYRLPIVLDVSMEKREEKNGSRKRCRGKTADISENAVQVSCFTRFEMGDIFDLKIKLSEKENIEVTGKVLRCIPALDKKDPYRLVIIFDEHSAGVSARLRQYIFSQQVKERKKEMDRLS